MNLESIYHFIRDATGSDKLSNTLNKKEWIMRCPWCGDSRNDRKGHLYISTDLMVWHCFRCDSSGSVRSLLLNLSFSDRKTLDEIKSFSKNYISHTKKYNILQTRTYTYTGLGYNNIQSKLEYLKSRLGESFISKENMDRFRIVPSIKQFIEFNKIENHKIEKEKLDWLDQKYIGFVCYRGAKIVFRSIESEPKIRYFVGKISDEIDVYAIPTTESQLEALKKNKIVLAEGPFDVAKSYTENILNLKDTSSIFVSVLSKAYVNAHWLTRSIFGLSAPETILLLDSDMNINKRTKNILVTNKIYAYKNAKGKDFGSSQILPVQV